MLLDHCRKWGLADQVVPRTKGLQCQELIGNAIANPSQNCATPSVGVIN
jgi:hypothetical protein